MEAIGGFGFSHVVGRLRSAALAFGSVVIVATIWNFVCATPSGCQEMGLMLSRGGKLNVRAGLQYRYVGQLPSSRRLKNSVCLRSGPQVNAEPSSRSNREIWSQLNSDPQP